ncbi:MAG: hypothetical protein ACR2NZ_13610, partial [Rubripirellula sp.]
KITGATRYNIEYNYRSRSQWRIDRGRRQLIITVRYQRIDWEPKHVIWLRDMPPTQGFWSGQILRHEFDHVRISNDPRMGKRFQELLREQAVFRHDLKPGETVNSAKVEQLVEQHVESIFQELADLISIRYVELDRETNHGAVKLPATSKLFPLLRGDEPKSDDSATANSN